MRSRRTLLLPVPLLAALALAAACNADPVHTTAVNALGPEVAGFPTGEFHRAGQPCLLCHGGEGPASSQFVVAGTVFFGPASTSPPVGVGNVNVTLEDDTQSQFTVQTNCVGNFVVRPGDWPGHPQFPMLVTISGMPQTQQLTLSMKSHIGRAGSCADCHQYPTDQNYFMTPGLIYMSAMDDPSYQGDQTCAVSPIPAGYGAP